MPMPCELTPRRSVRTMRSAVRVALRRDILSASSTETMKAGRASTETVTGLSDAAGARTRSSGQPGDRDAGALELVAPVDGREHRGDALDGHRAGEGSHVHRPA